MTHYFQQAFSEKKEVTTIIGLLLIIHVAIFAISVHYFPANGDDLRLLSSVANTSNPLIYFSQDAGEGKSEYRPLLSIPLWIVYRVVGVKAAINQVINLALHFINVYLLFRIVSRLHLNNILKFLVPALFLVSVNTVTSASWVADRPTLLVGLCLLLLMDYFVRTNSDESKIHILYVVSLTICALMSKESGVIVLLFALFASIPVFSNNLQKIKLIMGCLLILICYIGIHAELPPIILKKDAIPYDNWVLALSSSINLLTGLKNVSINVTAALLPIFNWEGSLLSFNKIVSSIFIWGPCAVLCVLSFSRPLTVLQKYGIFIIIVNSAIHFAAFRYRIQYLSWLGVCIFIGGTNSVGNNEKRQTTFAVIAFILLLASVIAVHAELEEKYLKRYNDLNRDNMSSVVEEYRGFGKIDDEIVKQIVARYKK
jgi:hypothetical protein